MPTLSKRPPARICAFLLALLFIAAAAPAPAQTAALWFAPHGKTPPQSAALSVFDAGALRAQRDGSRNFKVDIMYGDDVAQVPALRFQLHMDSSKLELLRVENLAKAQLPPLQSALAQTAYADYQSAIAPPPDDKDASTDTLIYPTWAAWSGGVFDAATRKSPARVATLHLKWKTGAAGNARLNFTANPGLLLDINAYAPTSLTVRGPSH